MTLRRSSTKSTSSIDHSGNLKIGDVVLLYYNADKRFAAASGDKSGFILADISGSCPQQLLTIQPAGIKDRELPNLQLGTFRVVVSNKYEAQTRYKMLVEKLKEFKRKNAGQSSIQLLQLQVTQAKRDSEVERQENAAKQRRTEGSIVSYGDCIQLQHMLTGKYVCVSTTDTSFTENTKLRVFLQRKDSVGCIFRLHPRIKVQTVGEEVNYDDQIKFESVATEGQYLHCSQKTFGHASMNVFSNRYELNLSSKDSPLKIIHHYHPSVKKKNEADNTLKASGVVRFFHRKHQCYITAEGSFVGHHGRLPELVDDNADSGIASSLMESTLRRKSVIPSPSPTTPHKLEVKADIEPIPKDRVSLADTVQSSFGSDIDPAARRMSEQDVFMRRMSGQESPAGMRKTSLEDSSSFLLPSRRPSKQQTIQEEDNESLLSFVVPDDQVVSEDAHFRRKRRTHGNLSSQASTSPNTFWKIEKFIDPCSGEPMQWSEQCRIKHLPTGRYLAVTGKSPHYKVTLKSHKLSPNSTVFELFPVVQQVGGAIDYESYVRIKHRDTGTWMHLNKDLRYTPSDLESIDGEEDLELIKEMFQIIATKDINSDDAFTVEKVADDLVTDFNYVAGVTSVLANQLQECESLGQKAHSPTDCGMGPALSSLKYLGRLLQKRNDPSDLKRKQKLLRSLKTLVLVVRLLNLHKNEATNDPEVCTACFGIIIHFLEGKSTKNKSYISGMMKHIFTSSVKDTELREGFTVEKALMGIARDNPNVLYESEVMTRIISYVMQTLKSLSVKSKKVVQLLEILTALCTCKGVPVKQNQIIILKQFQSICDDQEGGKEKQTQTLKSFDEEKAKYAKNFQILQVKSQQGNGQDTGSQVKIEMEETKSPFISVFKRKKEKVMEEAVHNVVQYQELESDEAKLKSSKIKGVWYDLRTGSKQFYKFFVAQINLLSAMCKGDNVMVIGTLQNHSETKTIGVELDFELVMSAIKDSRLRTSHPEVVASFIELMKVMFIEVGENRPFLEKFPFAFKFEEVGKFPFESTVGDPNVAAATALTGVVNDCFPVIRDWIKLFFSNEAEFSFAADEEDQNGVVVKVLQVLTVLVKFGYYDDSEDVNELLPAILKLLNGKDDYPSWQIKNSIQGMGDVQKQLTQVKIALQRGLSRRLSLRQSLPRHASENRGHLRGQASFELDEPPQDDEPSLTEVEEAVRKFRESGRFEYNPAQKNHFDIKYWAIEVLNLLFNFQLYKSLHSFIYDFRWLSQALPQERTKPNELEMVEIQQPRKIKHELCQLITTNPREPTFYKESPKLAKKVISAAKKRLKLISQSMGDSDLSNDSQLPDVLLDLACYKYNDLIQRSLLLLDRYYTSKTDIFQRALQSQLLLTSQSIELYNSVEKLFLKLTRYLRSGLSSDGSDVDKELSPVKVLTQYCWLEDEVEGFEPHEINRNIILSFGIFPDILNFVLQYCKGPLYIENGQKEKLIECFAFLRALACKNLPVQTRLIQHLDVFIKAASGELGSHIGGLLQETFSAGPSISLSVKEDQIWRIIKLVFGKGKEIYKERNSALLSALDELLMVRDLNLPLKHNQLVVARFISLIREDDRYWCRDLLGEGKGYARQEILRLKDDSDPRLSSLLMITDLLATCAYGENTGIDAICCTIYTEEELIEIISSEDISLYRKRPFMKLLVWVYMNVHGDKAEEISYSYRRNRLLWDHMGKMAAVLSSTADVMKGFLRSSYLSVKELVASPTWKYLHNSSERKHTNQPPQVILRGDNDYKEHFKVADVMLYYSEGFLPFLKIFYSEFYRKGHFDQSEQEGNATEEIYKALLMLFAPLNCKRVYFSQELQVKFYYRVLFLLKPNAVCNLNLEHKRMEKAIESMEDVFHHEIITTAREKYNKLYEEEVELNQKFHKFVQNYKAAYEGRNTRRDQIIDASIGKKNLLDSHPYSEFLDEEMTKPAPKYLPLGRHFQEHIALFNAPRVYNYLENPKEKLLKQLEISMGKMSDGVLQADHFDSERQTELDIKCLQILRAVIYNQIILIDEEDKERDPQKYKKQCEQHLHPIQNEIQDLGNTVSRVMPLLSHPNERIVYEVLAFLEAILQFGNTHVQEGLKELIQSRQHQVFPTLKAILNKASVVYKESQLLISLLKAQSTFDRKIHMKVAMQKDSAEGEDEDEPDFSVMSMGQRKSTVQADGSVLLTAPRRGSAIANLFKRNRTTKVVLLGGDTRVPFMALYQHSEADADLDGKSRSALQCYDLSRITLISKVLGLMCDGQYKEMQNYLREQSEDIHSVNMVAEMATFLYEFSTKQVISLDKLHLLNQLLQALKEFCIGNAPNREVVFNANIVSVINQVLQIDITKIRGSGRFGRNANTAIITNMAQIENIGAEQGSRDENIDFVQLRKLALVMKVSAVELLDALLEEISNKTSKLSQQIAEGLDLTALHWSMLDFYNLKGDQDLIRLQIDDNAYRALFDCYRIIMHLVDIGIAPLEAMKPTEKSILKAWDYCAERARSVEIVYKGDELEEEVLTRVHFNVNVNSDIREHLKDQVKFSVDRSTHAEKLRDYHEWMVAVKKDTLHHDSLKKKHLSAVKLFSEPRYWFLLLVILALNILLIVYYNPMEETVCPIVFEFQNGTLDDAFPYEYIVSTFVLGGVFALLTVWMLLEYFVVTWPHFVLPHFLYSLSSKLENHKLTRWIGRGMRTLLPTFEWTYSSVNIFGVETLYLVLFLPVAASPLYCFGYLYCYCFFYIIINNDILQRALKSVTKNWKSLLWVAVLLLIIIYCYSVISFATLREEFNSVGNNKFCGTLDQCFITVLRFGLIDSFLELDIDDGEPGTNDGANTARGRFFFDITFFIIVTTIGLNIVFGIIVDTFSELRDERFAAEQDLRSTCFICNLPSHEFDRLSNNGFQKHVKEDHNMWAYIYYSIYLDQIDVTNHNAIEKYVYEKIKGGSIDYIPFQKALVLQGHEADEDLKEELEQLEQIVNERFNTMNLRFDALESFLRARYEH